MSQAKHYVAYDTGGDNVVVDQQALHEIYVAPFVDAVNADVSSIMCSYNKVNGTYACGNSDTLVKILRDELGFKGFVTSDWGATHAPSFINHGLDMEMPGPGPKDSPLGSILFSFFTTEKPEPPSDKNPTRRCSRDLWVETCPKSLVRSRLIFASFGTSKDPRVNFWTLAAIRRTERRNHHQGRRARSVRDGQVRLSRSSSEPPGFSRTPPKQTRASSRRLPRMRPFC